jgi:hypothetical protein
MDYFDQLAKIYKRTVIDKRYVRELEDGKWRQVSGDVELNQRVKNFYEEKFEQQRSLARLSVNADSSVTLNPTLMMKAADIYQSVINLIFRNFVWLVLFVVMNIMAIRTAVRSKFRDEDAAVAIFFSLIFILKALLVSSVESSLERYSYTVEFAIYMSLPFTMILFEKLKSIKPQ